MSESTTTSCADSASTTTSTRVSRQYVRRLPSAAPIPLRVDWKRFDTSVGTISSATATSKGRNEPIVESAISGSAKPTTPFAKPPAPSAAAAPASAAAPWAAMKASVPNNPSVPPRRDAGLR